MLIACQPQNPPESVEFDSEAFLNSVRQGESGVYIYSPGGNVSSLEVLYGEGFTNVLIDVENETNSNEILENIAPDYQNGSTAEITTRPDSEDIIMGIQLPGSLGPTPTPGPTPSSLPTCLLKIGTITSLGEPSDSELYFPGIDLMEQSPEEFAANFSSEYHQLALGAYAHIEANCAIAAGGLCDDCSGCPDTLGGPICQTTEP